MQFQDYPFTPCLHPLHIVNPNTGNDMVVRCGSCEACLLNRCNKVSFLSTQEEFYNKYCYFVTLTYNDFFIPKAMPYYDELDDTWKFETRCDRHREEIELNGQDDYNISSIPFNFYTPNKMNLLLNKVGLNDCISYTYYRDIQLYIKRIKKLFSKYDKEETIRFYAVSEYGPKHFRVHFHLLIFNNSDKIHKNWQKVIRSSWRFGFVKCSLSRGKVAGYCSAYLNSTTTLPEIFKHGMFRPKQTHSRYFGFRFSKQEFDTYYQLPFENIMRNVVRVPNGIKEVQLPSTFQTAVFPRCKAYFAKSYCELFRTYTIIKQAYKDYGVDTTTNLTDLIVNDFYNLGFSKTLHYFAESFNDNLIKQIYYDSRHKKLSSSPLVRETIFNSIYNELLVSKHFVFDICNNDVSLFHTRLQRIIDFYNFRDIQALNDFYRKQESFMNDYPEYKYNICFFYDNFFEFKYHHGIGLKRELPQRSLRLYASLDGLSDNGTFEEKITLDYNHLFSNYKYLCNKEVQDKIKHKEQNELNIKYL